MRDKTILIENDKTKNRHCLFIYFIIKIMGIYQDYPDLH
jgi:hypothetical protein